MGMVKRGLLVVLSGPSGAGKDTILHALMKRNSSVMLSISATTRLPREGEIDGEHYHFLSKGQFVQMIARDELIEYAEYCGNYYGTPLDDVENLLDQGRDVVLEIEVQGAAQVMKKRPDAVGIFVLPPSVEVLENRLRRRGTESEAVIQKRLNIARGEMKQSVNYHYVIFNGELEDAVDELDAILKAEKLRVPRMRKNMDEVLKEC